MRHVIKLFSHKREMIPQKLTFKVRFYCYYYNLKVQKLNELLEMDRLGNSVSILPEASFGAEAVPSQSSAQSQG